MKFLKRNGVAIVCSIIILVVVLNVDIIASRLATALEKNPVVVMPTKDDYFKDNDSIYVQNTSDFVPLSYGDLLNIYFTITNSGVSNFTFYCPSEYESCLEDVGSISNDPETLTYINNFVHPYHGFSNIGTVISESGEINITVDYLYTQEEINMINQKVDEIYNKIIDASLSDYDKIKVVHDYIINNTKYDIEKNDTGNSPYQSNKAYGALLEGYATCNGYTDAMALFLEKMSIPNFKVATELMQSDISGHIWNAVYLNDQWLHLDLTWDDPVSDSGKDYLQHKYFLITSDELKNIDQSGEVIVKEHIFSPRVYPELSKK